MRVRPSFVYLAACCVIPRLAGASDPESVASPDSLHGSDKQPYRLAPVTITTTRVPRPQQSTPYAVSSIDLKQFQPEPGISLDEVLEQVPGLVVGNRHNLSQGDRLSIRGIGSRASFGVRGVRIIVDGIPLTMPDGQSQLSNLDLTSAGRIEVIRGASSSLYGNAGGGVVHIHTRSPHRSLDTRSSFEPRVVFGSYGLRRLQVAASHVTGAHMLFASANSLDSDGYRDHAAARSMGFNAVGRHRLSERLWLTSILNLYDAPYLLNPSSLSRGDADAEPRTARFFVRQQGALKKVRQGQAGLTLHRAGADSSHLKVTVYGLKRSLANPIPGRIIDLERTAAGLRSAYSRREEVRRAPLFWTAGIDVETQSDTRQEFANLGLEDGLIDVAASEWLDNVRYGDRQLNQDERVLGIGPFAELQLSFLDAASLTLGGRYDRYRFEVEDGFGEDGIDYSGHRTMARFSPMAGLTINPEQSIARCDLTFFGNVASAFQTPTTVELGNRPSGEGGFNPDLEPEVIHNREIGIRGVWYHHHLKYSLSVFDLEVERMLIPFQIRDSDEIFFRNAGRAGNSGTEFEASWRPNHRATLELAATASRFQFDDFAVESPGDSSAGEGAEETFQLAGNEVPGVPQQTVYAAISLNHPLGFYAKLDLRWLSDYFANDFNGPAPGAESGSDTAAYVNDGSLVTDLRISLKTAKLGFEFFLGVDNLLDKRYNGSVVPNAFRDRFFEPAPGRIFLVGVSSVIERGLQD